MATESWRNRKTLILSRTDMMGLLTAAEYVSCVEHAFRTQNEHIELATLAEQGDPFLSQRSILGVAQNRADGFERNLNDWPGEQR